MTDTALLPIHDPRLPDRLRHVVPRCDRLWVAGNPDVVGRRPSIGVIGSRHPRAEALSIARRIARDAARAGFTIVSGLAIGVDGAAHQQALDAGAPTIAVLAGGLGAVHPRQHRALARRIAGSDRADGVAPGTHPDAGGLVVTEYGAGEEPALRHRFQERNRIIAALSDYLVVVQANERSGSMGTARHALELGVPIGIVPSAPDDPSYSGSIMLIREGADAVVDGPSLFRRLEAHGVMRAGFHAAAMRGATMDPEDPGGWIGGGEHEQLALPDHPLASLVQVPRTAEELAELAGLELPDLRMLLYDLEEEQLVVRRDDGTWLAADAPS